jgi:hypothetical protein
MYKFISIFYLKNKIKRNFFKNYKKEYKSLLIYLLKPIQLFNSKNVTKSIFYGSADNILFFNSLIYIVPFEFSSSYLMAT